MNQSTTGTPASQPGSNALRFDIVAGLTAAAVVLPKAMAYATVAGLPVAVGLYTAFIPMVVYALLGSSRVLSVSSTATLAILTATQLGLVVPDGDRGKACHGNRHVDRAGRRDAALARLLKLGFVANFISTPVLTGFKAGIGLVIVLDQLPKLLGIHIVKQGFFTDLFSVLQHVPGTSMITLAVAVATFAVLIGMERLWPHSPAPLVAVGGGIAASWFFGLKALGVSTVGLIPQGFPSLTLPDLTLIEQLSPGALGIALMSFTETIAAGRAFARSGEPPINANRELVATGAGQPGRRPVRCDAGRRRHVADGGGACRGRAVAEGIAGHRGRRAGDDAVPGTAAGPDAPRDAGGRRHRLLGGTDPAGGVPCDPQRAHDGVPLGDDRRARRPDFRHAARASSWRSSCR